MSVTVNQNIVPTFTQLGPYCVGATPGTLPTTSNNGITGTWNPSTVSTASQGTVVYTFTPTAGLCATTATMSVTVNQNIVPTFTQLGPYCVGATPGTLPTTSNNGITGTWNPSTVSTASQGTVVYTFTPTARFMCYYGNYVSNS
jgi:alanine dehydrogenase